MKEVKDILKEIKQQQVKPVYAFDGEEPYYIDQLTDAFEQHLLEPHEKDFNLSIFYGKDSEWQQIVNECRSYPSFATRRLVILKEAAQLKDFNKLESYFEQPSPSTVLVIAHKYKKIDGRSKIASLVKKKGTYVTFDKIKDYQTSDWIIQYCRAHNIVISTPHADLLSAYLGTDLQKIVNEIEKVRINLKPDEPITADHIEAYIGISKDYNIFQFPSALMERDVEKSFKIVQYFIANPKEHPLVVIIPTVYGNFSKLYQFHYNRQLPKNELAALMKVSPYFLKDYEKAATMYNLSQTIQVIHLLAEYNLQAIGIGVMRSDMSVLKELTAQILAV